MLENIPKFTQLPRGRETLGQGYQGCCLTEEEMLLTSPAVPLACNGGLHSFCILLPGYQMLF